MRSPSTTRLSWPSSEEALALPAESFRVSRDVLTEHGNMPSATIFFILERLRRQAAPLPCVALAFAPGLTCELAIFTDSRPRQPDWPDLHRVFPSRFLQSARRG